MTVDSAAVNPAISRAQVGETGSKDLPSRAQYVVVGGGVIGTSIAYHLAKLGATDVVLLERRELTSGTTWHAAGEIVSGGLMSKYSAWMMRYSRDLYNSLEQETGLSTGFMPCGYLQLASTARREEAYRRETDFLRAYGVERHILSSREVADLVPMVKSSDVRAGFFTPDEGRANPVDVTMSLAKGAKMRGVKIFENTEVTGFVQSDGAVTAVETARGPIECEKVVIAAGLWGRELSAKAGVTVPLQAAEHYYLLTEPIEGITPSLPVIEDPESYGYFRKEGGGLLVGMFEPVGKAWSLDGTPRDSAFAVLPPDWDRMTPFLEVAMQRFPALEDAGIRTLFCGPESFTDDLGPMLGESPEVRNFYLACGLNSVGILAGGGLGHMMAQWLIDELPPLNVTEFGVDRTQEFEATRLFREERTTERLGFLLNDGSWPNAAPRTARDIRQTPLHPQHVADGAHFVLSAGWELPEWFAGPGKSPTVEWGFQRGEAFERIRDEHLNLRENVGAMDLSSMSKFLVQGPNAEQVLNRVCANNVAVPVGKVVYTQWLDQRGGIIADVTVTRMGEEEFMVISAENVHRRIAPWIRRQTVDGEFVVVTDVTSGHALLSVQGPNSRELLQRLSPGDWANDAFPFLTAQKVELGYTPLWALRVTYVGELGWDLLVPTEFCAKLYDQIREAGTDLGFRPTGLGALSTLRLEKAYRDMGHDIDSDDTPLEAGLGFAVAWDKPGGFIGRENLLKQREGGPLEDRLLTFLLSDPQYDLLGSEPIFWHGEHVGYMRVGAFGHSLGAATGLGEVHREGGITAGMIAEGGFEVQVCGTRVPAQASLKPFFDSDRKRPQS